METSASLIVRFGSTGAAEVKQQALDMAAVSSTAAKEMEAVARRSAKGYVDWWKNALKEQESFERDWLKAKDNREKELAAINRAQAAATSERFRQERNAAKASITDRDNLERDWLKAKLNRERELAAIEKAQSAATRERLRQEAAAQQSLAKEEERLFRQRAAAAKAAASEEISAAKAVAKAEKEALAERSRQARASAIPSEKAGATSLLGGPGRLALYGAGVNQALQLAGRGVDVAVDLVEEAAKWERMDMALKDMEGSAAGAAQSLGDLYEIAKSPAIDLQTAEHAYLQLRSLGMEGDKAQRVIKDFSNTIALSGGGSVEFERVLHQLVQMQSKGRVLNEDLLRIQDSMPRMATLMQKAFGTTTAEGIRDTGVNAKKFLDGLLAEMENLPRATQTLQSEMENAGTAWSKFKASFVDTDFVKDALSKWTGLLESMTDMLTKKSFNWIGLIKDVVGAIASPSVGGAKLISNIASDAYSAPKTVESQRKAIVDMFAAAREKSAAGSKLLGTAPVEPKISITPGGRLMTEAEWLAAFDRNNPRVAIPAGGVPEGPPAKEKKKPKTKAQKLADELAESDRKATEFVTKTGPNEVTMRPGALGADPTVAEHIKNREKAEKAAEEKAEILRKESEASYAAWEKEQDDLRKFNNEMERLNKKEAEELKLKYASEYELIDIEYNKQRDLILYNTALTGEQRNALMKRLDSEYFKQSSSFWTSNAELMMQANTSLFDALAASAKGTGKSMSLTYKTLFGISKSFAIADATLKMSQAIMNALASKPWPANMADIAAVTATAGGLISSINGLAFSGMFDKGGYIPAGSFGIAGEKGAEIVQGPAHVTSTRDTARILGGSKTTVNIMNYSGAEITATETETADGKLIEVVVGKVMAAVDSTLASNVVKGRGSFNSSLQQVYGLNRRGS